MYFLFADFRGEIIIIIIIIINLYSANIFGQSRAQHSTDHKFKLATTPLYHHCHGRTSILHCCFWSSLILATHESIKFIECGHFQTQPPDQSLAFLINQTAAATHLIPSSSSLGWDCANWPPWNRPQKQIFVRGGWLRFFLFLTL